MHPAYSNSLCTKNSIECLIFADIYLDDILFFRKLVPEYLKYVWAVLQCIHEKQI